MSILTIIINSQTKFGKICIIPLITFRQGTEIEL
jgi:hypothetical protein